MDNSSVSSRSCPKEGQVYGKQRGRSWHRGHSQDHSQKAWETKRGEEYPGGECGAITGREGEGYKQESPERVAHRAEAENDVQVVAHALNEVGKEAIGGLWHLLCPGLLCDVCLNLHRSQSQRAAVSMAEPEGASSEAELTRCGFLSSSTQSGPLREDC